MKKKINLLLIEDCNEDIVLFKRLVSKSNNESQLVEFSLHVEESFSDGVLHLKKEQFDLVLLDLSLPDASGVEMIERFKTESHLSNPIIILTGDQRESCAIEAIQAGAQDYLLKKELSAYLLIRSCLYAIERFEMAEELELMRINQAKNIKMATLGEIAGNIAHEVNNPLSVILGYADRIYRESKSKEELAKLHGYSEKIVQVTNRIAKIVKNLKAYSRQDELDPMVETSLISIVEDTIDLCSEKFKMASIKLVVSEIPDVEILCKDIQLSQVLLNLLNNAHDAIKNENEKWVKIYSQLEHDNLNIFIVDSGSIINSEVKKKIFSPLFTTKDKNKGTGLGMSISKNIIESHGGTINLLESEANTTFKISLPLCKSNNKAA